MFIIQMSFCIQRKYTLCVKKYNTYKLLCLSNEMIPMGANMECQPQFHDYEKVHNMKKLKNKMKLEHKRKVAYLVEGRF